MNKKQYKILFYETATGKPIIISFIESLEDISKARVRNSLRLLGEHGLELLQSKRVKKLTTKPNIFELRVTDSKQIKLLFFFYDKATTLIVHAFVKKTIKTPKKDLNLAIKRAKEFI